MKTIEKKRPLIRVLRSNGDYIQSFWPTLGNSDLRREINITKIIHDNAASTVALIEEEGVVLKLIKARSWHEHAKVFWGRSRTHTEFNGGKLLNSIGIDTPHAHEMGISIPIFTKAKYIGYYLMENIEEKGYKSLADIRNNLSDAQINQISKELTNIFNELFKNRIVYSDFHIGNVFINQETMSLKLIDTGAKLYHIKKKHHLKTQSSIKNFKRSISNSNLTESRLSTVTDEVIDYIQKSNTKLKCKK